MKGSNSFMKAIGNAIGPILFFLVCVGACFALWKIRDRQPGNTRYSVAIYCGMGGCLLLMFLGLWAFGIFK